MDMAPNHTRHVGKFTISWHLIDHNPNIVRQLLSKMIIVRAESMHATNEIEYIAICEEFSYVELGQIVPTYEIEIDSRIEDMTKLKAQGTRRLILVLNEET